MSDGAASEAERLRYLAEVLEMNPVVKAEEMLQRRRAFHGLAGAAEVVVPRPAEVRQQREVTQGLIDQLRESFWSMKPGELKRAFAAIDASPFPDLQLAVDRLQTLARHRPALAKLSLHPHFNGELFSVLKRVLVLPSRAAEGARQKLLKELSAGKERKIFQAMIRLLKTELPELYELERAWFDRF